MDIEIIKDWLIPISTFVALVTASISGWLSLKEYRLKVRAETRLANSSELEADIKLLKLFTEIMDIAHARNGYHISEKAIEKILTPEIIKEFKPTDSNLNSLLNSTVISYPVGVAAQDASIAAIWVLGQRHESLRQVTIQALESLCLFKKDVAQVYLNDLKAKYPNSYLQPNKYEETNNLP